jgi:hypothetical protein
MGDPQIQPDRITKPFQMLAVWMAALVLLVGSLLTAARLLTQPDWLPPFLAISAVVLVPLFLVLLFLMQTKFRAQLQEDAYYAQWLVSEKKVFQNFAPENLPGGEPGPSPEESNISINPAFSGADDLEETRVRRYQKYQGVFLVHAWRPSRQSGQVADIVFSLRQHGEGPLKAGLVDHVEYALGRKFFPGPVLKINREDDFKLEVSAYGPMLCVARVCLTDGSSFDVERYADFDPDIYGNLLSSFRGGGLMGRLSDMR